MVTGTIKEPRFKESNEFATRGLFVVAKDGLEGTKPPNSEKMGGAYAQFEQDFFHIFARYL